MDKSIDSAQPVTNSNLNKPETEIPMKRKKCSKDITERILAAEVVFLPETTVPVPLITALIVTPFYGLRNSFLINKCSRFVDMVGGLEP